LQSLLTVHRHFDGMSVVREHHPDGVADERIVVHD
jgi:hypothetical protein